MPQPVSLELRIEEDPLTAAAFHGPWSQLDPTLFMNCLLVSKLSLSIPSCLNCTACHITHFLLCCDSLSDCCNPHALDQMIHGEGLTAVAPHVENTKAATHIPRLCRQLCVLEVLERWWLAGRLTLSIDGGTWFPTMWFKRCMGILHVLFLKMLGHMRFLLQVQEDTRARCVVTDRCHVPLLQIAFCWNMYEACWRILRRISPSFFQPRVVSFTETSRLLRSRPSSLVEVSWYLRFNLPRADSPLPTPLLGRTPSAPPPTCASARPMALRDLQGRSKSGGWSTQCWTADSSGSLGRRSWAWDDKGRLGHFQADRLLHTGHRDLWLPLCRFRCLYDLYGTTSPFCVYQRQINPKNLIKNPLNHTTLDFV